MSRKLDVAIAEALGYEVTVVRDYLPCTERYYMRIDQDAVLGLRLYSTNSDAMLDLDKEMRERGFQLNITRHFAVYFKDELPDNWSPYVVRYYKPGNNLKNFWTYGCEADTMPEAVALAAYKALTGKEWEE